MTPLQSTDDMKSRPAAERRKIAILHLAARIALAIFERRTRNATKTNFKALKAIIKLNRNTAFGRDHDLASVKHHRRLIVDFKTRVPLTDYAYHDPYIERIAAGEENVLASEPTHLLAGTSGTSDRPKRIPRTRRAQRHHTLMVQLAEQGVVDRNIPGAKQPDRGISLMSRFAPPKPKDSAVPVMSGPNSGMKRIRKLIPLLWSSPGAVFGVAHQPTALYLHALFGLLNRRTLYIQTVFAPQMVGWFTLMEKHQQQLVRDMETGALSDHLELTESLRKHIEAQLSPEPQRAREVATEFRQGFEGIALRLWPNLKYMRCATTGTFALSLPKLRWFVGPDLPIQSGAYSASEGVVGINLKTDGSIDYVLAVGTSFYEFIPLAYVDESQPQTVDVDELQVGQEYEVVLTSCAGLYRYRLGDMVRVTGRYRTAPTFEYLYRRGTLLNLVGEKTSEFHTAQALTTTLQSCFGSGEVVKNYTVSGDIRDGMGGYTFYVELQDKVPVHDYDLKHADRLLDDALCELNPYYLSNGREAERMKTAKLELVSSGTFDALLHMQLERAGDSNATQIKIPRVVNSEEQLVLLQGRLLTAQILFQQAL